MVRIIVGGQMGKQEIADLILKNGADQVTVDIKNDLDAVMAMKAKQYDYYLGACNTGGGGALAMAIALLGNHNCVTVASPNGIISDEDIMKGVNEGKIAFGFTPQYSEKAVPVIIKAILSKQE